MYAKAYGNFPVTPEHNAVFVFPPFNLSPTCMCVDMSLTITQRFPFLHNESPNAESILLGPEKSTLCNVTLVYSQQHLHHPLSHAQIAVFLTRTAGTHETNTTLHCLKFSESPHHLFVLLAGQKKHRRFQRSVILEQLF